VMARSKNRRRKDAKGKRKTRSTRPTAGPAAGSTAGRAARPTSRPTAGATGTTKATKGPPRRLIDPWWERWRDRLEWELQELQEKGLACRVDEESRARGQIVLYVDVPLRGEQHTLRVVFPDFYPELRCEVYAPKLDLPRHQNPFGKNLCLLDRDTRHWRPTDSAAWCLTERLPQLVELLKDEQALRKAEAPQGEPFTDYFIYERGSIVFVPGFAVALPREVRSGWIHLRPEVQTGAGPLRALVYEVDDDDSRTLGRADPELAGIFSGQRVTGRWIRLEAAPQAANGPEMLHLLSQTHPDLVKPRWRPLGTRKLDIVGLVFPEEVTQGRFEDGWLLLVREKTGPTYLCRAHRIAEEDFLARIPELTALRACTIGVTGLGGLGAPSTLEFARCQVGELRLLDYDMVEAGTIVRWPFGLEAAGRTKAEVLFSFIRRNYPYTRLRCYEARIGATSLRPQAPSEREVLSEFLDGVDLIYDATAESGVQYLLSNLARDWKLPQVYVTGTEGGWGGMVTRCIPDKTGCWLCLKHHLDDGTLPLPSLQANGTTQPRGCATRTFTGAGFDLLPIVAQGTRVTVQTLLARSGITPEERRYPQADHDVSVLYLRDAQGNPTGYPLWEHHKLEVHPRCEFCAKA
jgi:molybdopterin/thiamine biosynthesis adenylyltransferase